MTIRVTDISTFRSIYSRVVVTAEQHYPRPRDNVELSFAPRKGFHLPATRSFDLATSSNPENPAVLPAAF
jgi:hypothetical protein